MTRWDAFHDLRGAQEQAIYYLTRMLGQTRGQELQQSGFSGTSAAAWSPAIDISERNDAYVVAVELPGVKLDDLEIAYQDGLLTIQGERDEVQASEDEQTHLVERRYGQFRRSITLPLHVAADAIDATFEDGVLRVVIPKAEEAKPKRIEVHAVASPALAGTSNGTTK
ncbi:Hsp20/alpha crystallin family protein [Actinophytocola sp.]|uniref:Hsp20/alpha crystallin family protein n=1 Tax=Actinophytocola sp. TaxID=1872138 RepID=UPI002D8099B4|nr:Hsp20/alpha crystallin family protein [Actinophytocola sp.]HET9140386.1 Hsp20/alpha crystallin family protein [Actinophytocola sp.]